MPNSTSRKPAVEQEQINTVVNHREYPAPLTQIAEDTYSVVVIGAGPAGLMVSSSLARLGGGNGAQHSVLTVDLRTRPTEAGRADGELAHNQGHLIGRIDVVCSSS
jgi:NADPH-dependent 2,4-dienoyl-CoA reductase/sulfur reductase-like enzyme